MKKITTVFLLFSSLGLLAQTTHNVDWFIGVGDITTTIDVGDTVNWIFTDAAPHTVTSTTGSTAQFDSGTLVAGSTYSFTFNEVGSNPYRCEIHPSTMTGTVVVEALGIDDEEISPVEVYPNPVTNILRINAEKIISTAQLVNISGQIIWDVPIKNRSTTFDMTSFSEGLYFVNLNFEDGKKRNVRIVVSR